MEEAGEWWGENTKEGNQEKSQGDASGGFLQLTLEVHMKELKLNFTASQ